MAILSARRLLHARPLLAAGTLVVAAVVAVPVLGDAGLAGASPQSGPHAQPSATDIQRKLGQLAVKNTQLVEAYNQARIATTKAQKSATTAKARAATISRTYAVARTQYVKLMQAQYEGSSLGAAGALLESSSDADYLTRVDSLGMLSTHVSQVVDRIDATRTAADDASSQAAKLYSSAKSKSDALGKQRKQLTGQMNKYRSMLQQLNSQQRADYLRAQNPSKNVSDMTFPKAPSAAAQAAVAFALKQLGKPYVFGAAGPGSFDCSGLTMAAWQAGGVSLPHSAEDQYNYGTHVSMGSLTPGDLIFMYQPIGHVTIYIGDGYMVSAPTEGEDVTVVPVSAFNGDIVGATHLG